MISLIAKLLFVCLFCSFVFFFLCDKEGLVHKVISQSDEWGEKEK